ncbi:MAG: hypothetical protein IKP86_13480 [Anaerolineaceae bacterium]|nr:hypothetical protein [Anaerolineaceae bacterium]
MREPLIFFTIFGVLLILSGIYLRHADDPRKSPFFAKVHGNFTKAEGRAIAAEMGKWTLIIGIVIVIVCLAGLLVISLKP